MIRFPLSLAAAALSAVVLRDLWTWFVVPLGVMSIGFWHAYGISILVSRLTHQIDWAEIEKPVDTPILRFFVAGFYYLMIWGVGALVSFGVPA